MAKPSLTRRHLGKRLRTQREKAGLSLRAVEDTHIIGSVRTLARLESGYSVSVTYPVIGELCRLYGVPDTLRLEMERMYREVDRPGWWEPYTKALIRDFALFVELERFASELLIYEPDVITGLLQTEAYARGLHEKDPQLDAATIQKSVLVRMRRQEEFWQRDSSPQVSVLMGETALRGGCDDAQLERIKELAGRPEVDIRVLPIEQGPYPSLRGPFQVLKFEDDDDPDCIYMESLDGSRYEEKPAALEIYHRVFRSSFDQARPIEEF